MFRELSPWATQERAMPEAAENEVSSRSELHAKMEAEIAKLFAETVRINEENQAWPWFPIFIALIGNAGLTGIAVAIVIAAMRH
jgi:hypothetical protein